MHYVAFLAGGAVWEKYSNAGENHDLKMLAVLGHRCSSRRKYPGYPIIA
jgi:hypothetical protein